MCSKFQISWSLVSECMSFNMFKEHIQCIATKICCNIGLISRVRRCSSLDHSKMLFNATIRPHLDYCSHVLTDTSRTTSRYL